MNPVDELVELINQLSGSLRSEDLEDQGITAMLAQLLTVLENKSEPLDTELIEKLSSIKDLKERFIVAAEELGVGDTQALYQLSEQMKESGLLQKHD